MKKAIVKTLLIIAAVSVLSMGATVGCSTQPKSEQEDISIVDAIQGEWYFLGDRLTFIGNKSIHISSGSSTVKTNTYISNVTDSKGLKWARYDQRPNQDNVYRYDAPSGQVHGLTINLLNLYETSDFLIYRRVTP